MSEVTRILNAIEHGDPSAAEQLLPLVYEELRMPAAQRLAQEKPGQTLQATALAHEAYFRLVDVDRGRLAVSVQVGNAPPRGEQNRQAHRLDLLGSRSAVQSKSIGLSGQTSGAERCRTQGAFRHARRP